MKRLVVLVASAVLTACSSGPLVPETQRFGPSPTLPEPSSRLLPLVNIAPVARWSASRAPMPASGLRVQPFAEGLDHPRWLHVLPNGDVLVAETNAPPKPANLGGGLRGWITRLVMARAGAGVPSANRITLLRDADGDGVAEIKTAFIENLFSPFGMALVGDRLYVANADAVVSFPYREGQTRIDAPPVKVADLPAGRNHHWTKSLVASPDGRRLYVGVGSNSNIAEHGMAEEVNRAAILEIDPATGATQVYASGLRNPVGLDWNPVTGELWTAVNERDELGNDLVPDYMTSVRRGAFYGWPWSYWGQTVDARVRPRNPEMVARAVAPDYALGAHTASLGLAFATGAALGSDYAEGVFVGQHGSWNREPPSGYKVIFVPFENGRPAGLPRDVLTGFLSADGEAQGRPVGVAIDRRGGLLVADDVGNVVWRVSRAD
ncbi:PQQ-dependent sugar dehydrogenase [Brevundimonas balnearis]|uniref:PQQ-dependent sugar dehydrogenase n=1 Tax=Brevundimonas balnearis TaxID=1572858 RepID=A0ABV6R545_9CAUL